MDTKGLVRALGEESLLRHVCNTHCNAVVQVDEFIGQTGFLPQYLLTPAALTCTGEFDDPLN